MNKSEPDTMSTSVKTRTKPGRPDDPTIAKARALLLLQQSPGFRDCPPQALDAMLTIGHIRYLRRHEFLHRRNEVSMHVAFVIDGLLESSVLWSDGHRHLYGLLQPGVLTNLVGLSHDAATSHDIQARTDATLLMLPMLRFRELRQRHTELLLACEMHLAIRTRLTQERLAADPALPLETRVAGMLHMLTSLYGSKPAPGLPSPARIELETNLSQADLADWLGMSRQRVNFALKKLEAEGLIELRYSGLTVIDADRLKRAGTP